MFLRQHVTETIYLQLGLFSFIVCHLGEFYLKIYHLLSDLAQVSGYPQESYPESIRLFYNN